MAKRPITNELYNKLLESFRQRPGEYAAAARFAQCDPRTAARAWRVGWVPQNAAWAPISKVLEQEALAARARMQTETAEKAEVQRTSEAVSMAAEREKATADALEARAQEAQMVRLLRSDVTGGLAAVARTLPGMQKWAQWAAEWMVEHNPKSLREVMKMMAELSKVTERTAAAADRVMAIERRLLGKPEMILGMTMPDISLEEAVEHIEASQETLREARACGLLPPARDEDGNPINVEEAEWDDGEEELSVGDTSGDEETLAEVEALLG